jgi:hypothetical protein
MPEEPTDPETPSEPVEVPPVVPDWGTTPADDPGYTPDPVTPGERGGDGG